MSGRPPIGMLLLDEPDNAVLVPTAGYVSPSEAAIRRVVEDCTVDRLVGDGDARLEEAMVVAARELVDQGARAITGNCGFMIRYQAAVSSAVDVPVLLSSLLLAPLLLRCIGGGKKLGIVAASAAWLTEELLRRAGVSDSTHVVVGDLADRPAFRAAFLECTSEPDRSKIEEETVAVTRALMEKHPQTAAILLDCTALPPYTAAIQEAAGVPVFDPVGLIDLFVTGFAPPPVRRF